MDRPMSTLADNLQRLREERHLSLAQLAQLTGVSKSMLRQIETGQSSPTIATVWKIANGIKVPFTALLQHQPVDVTLRPFKEDRPLQSESTGYRLFPLVLFSPHRPFEIYYVEIDPDTSLDAEPHQGSAEEHVFVLQGQLHVTVGSSRHTVTGQSFVSFDAQATHRYENTGREMATAIMMISYVT